MNDTTENLLFNTLLPAASLTCAPIFILGAPRTGSTLLYQALCSRLGLPYFANLTNDSFAETPLIGLSIQKAMPVEIGFRSRYGKTDGAFQPSEASAIMSRWFGGGHPSAVVSASILDGMEPHFVSTLVAAEALFGMPLAIKNAWNCFRVPYIAQTLPGARFLWIRRDIVAAAKSDMEARYTTKGSATGWNSATPANVKELQKLPPTAQVIENQYAFNRAIGDGLRRHAKGCWREIWYEDFVENPDKVLDDLGAFLAVSCVSAAAPICIAPPRKLSLPPGDSEAIDDYLSCHAERLVADRNPALR